jgi:ABC-2 type transport system permease protein
MYWTHVARKEFADAVRSKLFIALSAVMVLFAYIGMSIPQALNSDATASDGIATLSSPMLLFVPVIALVVGYMSVVSERETGSIRMVLSLPLRRGEVLLGKFVGRTGVVAVPVLLAFALAVPLVYLLYGSLPVDSYAEFVSQVVLTILVFVAIAVGVSGSVDSRGKALAGVVGIFLVFQWFWSLVPVGLYFLANGDLPEANELPTWAEFISQLSPGTALRSFVDGLFSVGTASGDPLVLQWWVAGIIVALWILVPLGVGYLRVSRANIS